MPRRRRVSRRWRTGKSGSHQSITAMAPPLHRLDAPCTPAWSRNNLRGLEPGAQSPSARDRRPCGELLPAVQVPGRPKRMRSCTPSPLTSSGTHSRAETTLDSGYPPTSIEKACARSGDAVMRCSLGASLMALATHAVRSCSPADAMPHASAHRALSQSAEHEPTRPSCLNNGARCSSETVRATSRAHAAAGPKESTVSKSEPR